MQRRNKHGETEGGTMIKKQVIKTYQAKERDDVNQTSENSAVISPAWRSTKPKKTYAE